MTDSTQVALAKIRIKHEKHMIEVLEAFVAGKTIQEKIFVGTSKEQWADHIPDFGFTSHPTRYRIKPAAPDSINWDHVAPEYKWMSRDENGQAFLYTEKPEIGFSTWNARDGKPIIYASGLSSFKAGDKPWNESLVERPQ